MLPTDFGATKLDKRFLASLNQGGLSTVDIEFLEPTALYTAGIHLHFRKIPDFY